LRQNPAVVTDDQIAGPDVDEDTFFDAEDDLDESATRGHERLIGIVKRVLPIVSVIVFLIIWEIVGSHQNPILFTTPKNVVKAFWDLSSDGKLGPAFVTSMTDLGIGYGLAIVVGILIGIAMGRSPVVERIINPYVDFFQATPLIALVPLVVIWFGIGLEARVVVTFMLAVWSIIINTSTGVKGTPTSLIDVTKVYKFNRFQVVSQVALPNAVPSIFAGLRISLGKALIGMVIAEMEVSVTGLGGMVITYGDEFRTADLLAAVVTASAVGVIVAVLLDIIRRVLFPWTKADRAGRG
jgi:ABC-type nitrate/sulfonate/bicarbonate transport system permease component